MTDILLIKTSSMGDVLHNLPVASDIAKRFPHAQIDWVVEESFAAMPALHPAVRNVIPVAMRRWRKSWWASRHEIRAICKSLGKTDYDHVIDTQGLLKSAIITRCLSHSRAGYDWHSAREPLASLFYDHTYSVARDLHAVERNRILAGFALGYEPSSTADYGIRPPGLELDWLDFGKPYIVLLHATSRDDKLWNEKNWVMLGHELALDGFQLILPWGNAKEHQRSQRLAASIPNATCPPTLNLTEAAALLGKARAAIGVDTGLSHLAAAFNIPTIGIYTATEPGLTGLYAGQTAVNLGGIHKPPSVDIVLATCHRLLGDA